MATNLSLIDSRLIVDRSFSFGRFASVSARNDTHSAVIRAIVET